MRLLLVMAASVCLLSAAEKFSGTWSSSENGAGGTLQIQLSEPGMVTFTLRGDEVRTKMLSMKKDGARVELRYEFDLGGTKLISTLTGTVAGDKLDGKYRTATSGGADAVDGGSFSASAQ
jgi:hypothetical protein